MCKCANKIHKHSAKTDDYYNESLDFYALKYYMTAILMKFCQVYPNY